MWRPSSAGRARGTRCAGGRRATRAARARSGRSGGPADRGRRAAARGRSALRSGPGEAPRPPRGSPPAAGRSARRAARGGGRRRRGLRADCAAAAARAPNTKHSLSEFEASRLAPCRPVQAHSPTANRPGSEERPVEVGGDPAHQVVGGGRDRDRLARRVEARPRARASKTFGKRASLELAQVEQDVVGAVGAPSGRGSPA